MPDGQNDTKLDVVVAIDRIDATAWDKCAGKDNPFVRHGFLSALEDSGSVGGDTGWTPRHLVLRHDDGSLLACVPSYVKAHSYGEYVFDWAWADAFTRAGGRYYPKLQVAVPFTPVTGPRLMVHPDAPDGTAETLALGLVALAQQSGLSSIHVTFPTDHDASVLEKTGFLHRIGHQFHWENKDYSDFDDFLAALTSRKRKAIRKERQALQEHGITFRALRGDAITEGHWRAFYRFYRNTVDNKFGGAYLTQRFFPLLSQRLGDQVVLMAAEQDGRLIAGALNLLGGDTLYGRNWGCDEDYKFLHFEACYYQAIDFAIENGLKWVEAGAQGRHKVQRGYLPRKTHSAHWINDAGFRAAVERFLTEETAAIEEDIKEWQAKSPYRQD